MPRKKADAPVDAPAPAVETAAAEQQDHQAPEIEVSASAAATEESVVIAEPAESAVALFEQVCALSRELVAAGQHAEHAVVNEIEVLLGMLRHKAQAEVSHDGVKALLERIKTLL